MPIQQLSALSPEPRHAAETYLRDVADALGTIDPAMRDDLLADLESHLLECLDAAAATDDVSRLIAELGSPEAFSAELGGSAMVPSTAGHGSVLGVPYDVRIPTAERVAERMWDPRDPRIFMPRIFGMGWDVNFGSIAVRLHLIEPDSEDVPFASTPQRAFWIAVAVPIAMTAAMLVSCVALRSSLPAQLPVHWNAAGVPDAFRDQLSAFGFLFAMALAPTAWATWSDATRRPALLRGATVGFATLFATLGAALWLLTLISVLTSFVAWWLPVLLIGLALLAPFITLVWLARTGRAAEQQRDFANTLR